MIHRYSMMGEQNMWTRCEEAEEDAGLFLLYTTYKADL